MVELILEKYLKYINVIINTRGAFILLAAIESTGFKDLVLNSLKN